MKNVSCFFAIFFSAQAISAQAVVLHLSEDKSFYYTLTSIDSITFDTQSLKMHIEKCGTPIDYQLSFIDSITTTGVVENFYGKWTGFGFNVINVSGFMRHDTMHVSLSITPNGYSLYRDYMQMGSAMSPLPDTIIEEGTWAKTGGDSLVLTPQKCVRYNFDEGKVMQGPCNPPVRLTTAISGTTWQMNMQNLKDPTTSTPVILTKKVLYFSSFRGIAAGGMPVDCLEAELCE